MDFVFHALGIYLGSYVCLFLQVMFLHNEHRVERKKYAMMTDRDELE